MSEEENGAVKVLKEIKRGQNTLARATVALYLALLLFGGVAWWVRSADLAHVDDIAQRNLVALCAFRQDVEQRVESAEEFLRDHPNGIPGISPELLQSNITNQQRTVDALAILDCSSVEEG